METKEFILGENLFKVGDNYVGVSDEKIKDGDWCICEYADGGYSLNLLKDSSGINKYKVIFSTKYIDETIPTLDIEEESVIENIATEYAKDSWGVYFDDVHPDSAITLSMGELTEKDFLAGYEKAKEKYKHTEENLRKVFEDGYLYHAAVGVTNKEQFERQFKDTVNSLNAPKEIKSININYYCKNSAKLQVLDFSDDLKIISETDSECLEYRPELLPNGKIKCKVNYK